MVNSVSQVQPWFTSIPAEIDIFNEKPVSILQAPNQYTVDPFKSAAVV